MTNSSTLRRAPAHRARVRFPAAASAPVAPSRSSPLACALISVALLTLLAGCGDGGSAGGGSAGAKIDGPGQPHLLGGTITGLTASGLTLRNGDDSVSPAAQASTFVFPKTLDDGASYAITLASQPGGFNRCSLGSDAAGTIVTSDLLTIAVSCSQAGAAVSTIAGSGERGFAEGVGAAASFAFPYGTAVDAAGNVFVADGFNHQIRKIAPDGSVSVVAGSGLVGADNGAAGSASFSYPFGVAIDTAGTLYVADWGNHQIRKITADGTVSTLAGGGVPGSADGSGAAASFSGPYGVAVDGGGNLYVADTNNNLIRRITAAGEVTTLAGSGEQGAANGNGTAASFNTPHHLAVDPAGNLLIADTGNHSIRRITPAGAVTTVAGNGQPGASNGSANTATFSSPGGVAVDATGTIYVADSNNQLIRRITAAGQVSTLAGSGSEALADGLGGAASFNSPRALAVAANGDLLVPDARNHSVRRIVAQ